MTDGRTAGEFPDGVPKSGLGGMKGVAGSESSMMMDGCWGVSFFHGLGCSLTRIGDKRDRGNEWTHEERMIWTRALFGVVSSKLELERRLCF
jgi:hypothetical protein